MRRSTGVFCVCLGLFLGAAAGSGQDAPRDEVQSLRVRAADAHRAKDWPALLEATRRLRDLDPVRPGNIYNLACAEALNGHAEASARLLYELLDRGIDYGIGQDADLASARAEPVFEPLLRRVAELGRRTGSSEVAFRLPEKDLLTEGIAYDPASRSFFVSSVHRRKILRRSADGKISDFKAEGQDGLEAVLALSVDVRRRTLWACSAAMPQMRGYAAALEGSTALFAFDVKTGKLLRKIALPRDGKGHALGDLAVAENGDVFATDGLGGGIYLLRRGGEKLEEVVPPGVFRSPQGIVPARNGSRLYVGDWGSGLFFVDLPGRTRREVAPPPGVSLIGLDALIRSGEDLVVTLNLLHPARVVRLALDASGERVARAVILDRADPEFAEPTLGVVVNDSVYVVGKSQWARFDEKTGAADEAALVEPAILKIPLRPAS